MPASRRQQQAIPLYSSLKNIGISALFSFSFSFSPAPREQIRTIPGNHLAVVLGSRFWFSLACSWLRSLGLSVILDEQDASTRLLVALLTSGRWDHDLLAKETSFKDRYCSNHFVHWDSFAMPFRSPDLSHPTETRSSFLEILHPNLL